jgi:carboxyl-terminal processing protease
MMRGANSLLARVAVVAALLLSGCASFDPHRVLSRHLPYAQVESSTASSGAALSTATRQAAVDAVWSTVNDRYYRADLNGVDWLAARKKWEPQALAAPNDNQFWERLDHMAGELADAHTRVESPTAVARRKAQQSLSLGLNIRELDGALIVLSVHPEGDAYWAGVRSGMRLAQIGQRDAAAQWREWAQSARKTSSPQAALRAPLRRLNLAATEVAAQGLALQFERTDGTRFNATLKPRTLSTRPTVSHRVLPSGIGYVRFTEFQETLRSEVLAAFSALKDTSAMILDLRGNGGGSAAMVEALVSRFFSKKTLIGRLETRTGLPVTLGFGAIKLIELERTVPGDAEAYAGRLAVLIDSDSASASEATAGALQSTGRAVVVGETSCGCLLMYLGYATLPGGGELAYSELGFSSINGERIEGRGITPDLPITRSVDDIRAGRDRALEMAQSALLK